MQHLHNRQCYSSIVSILLCDTYTIDNVIVPYCINITMQHLHNRQCCSSTVSILLCNTYTIGYRYYLFLSLIPSSDRHPPPRDVPSRAPYPYIVTKRQGQVSCVPLPFGPVTCNCTCTCMYICYFLRVNSNFEIFTCTCIIM